MIEGLVTDEWRSVLTSARRNPRIVVEIGVIVIVVALCVLAIIHAEETRRCRDTGHDLARITAPAWTVVGGPS